MTARIQATIPVLASLDLNETVAFYADRLGFTPRSRFDDYAILGRDGAEIHFWLCRERHIAENTSCYVRVAGIQALYEEFRARIPDLRPPVARPWGMTELYVFDPHGNLLKFGEPA